MTVLDTRTSQALVNDRAHVFHSWSAQGMISPIVVAGAEGSWFWDEDGKRYLDAIAGVAVNAIGHCHPKLVAALREQVGTLIHTSNLYEVELQEKLAAKLCELSGMDKVFFCNSGAEANECAIKLARYYGHKKNIDNPAVVVLEKSFHGRTLATLAAGGNKKYLEGFGPVVEGFDQVAFGDLEATKKAIGPHTCAILIEPVQGEGGFNTAPFGFIKELRKICDEHGILLIADEVMAGFGRTGRWFAIDHSGVVPDMITMAKGLTSAYVQLGALGMRRAIADHFAEKVFGAGLTYNSHPLACATALATIAVYEEDGLIARAATSGLTLRAHHERMKAKHPCVGPIRNIGLFGIMELVRDPKRGTPIAGFNEIVPEMVALGKFFRANGLYTIVRWNGFFTNPPLNISDDELDFAFDVIDRGLAEVDAALGLV